MARKRYPKRLRTNHKVISYRDSSSEPETERDSEPENDFVKAAGAPKRPRSVVPRAKPTKSVKNSHSIRANPLNVLQAIPGYLSDGVIPPWSTLPYEMWIQIFTYASYPLHDDHYRPTESLSWLVKAIRICKDLAEPAVSVLYKSPPLYTLEKPHLLSELLQTTTSNLTFNYSAKIKVLDLDLDSTLSHATTGKGRFDLTSFVTMLPKLKKIDIIRPINRPPYRDLRQKAAKWYYPDNLFTVFGELEFRLQSWRFDEDLLLSDKSKPAPVREELVFEELGRSNGGFQYLKHLTISRFQQLFTLQRQHDLQECLLKLKDLRSLEFESCVCSEWRILEVMPLQLAHLTFTNCSTLTSQDLQSYLEVYGSSLRSLTLNHNRALNLSFLENLKRTSPRLEVLRVDCNYFSNLENRTSSDPGYEYILDEDQSPTWPSSLQFIEMLHLRKWTSKSVETFFASLIHGAPELPLLRTLILKIILDIGWRDRAGFREDGIGELRQVFLRHSIPPNPNLSSLRAFRVWESDDDAHRTTEHDRDAEKSTKDHDPCHPATRTLVETSTPRKSRRILQQETVRSSSSVQETNFQTPKLPIRSKLDNPDGTNRKPEDGKRDKNLFIQGLCNVVDISIDNLRLREVQFHESDFMDSEVSGDEDWTADGNPQEGSEYAW